MNNNREGAGIPGTHLYLGPFREGFFPGTTTSYLLGPGHLLCRCPSRFPKDTRGPSKKSLGEARTLARASLDNGVTEYYHSALLREFLDGADPMLPGILELVRDIMEAGPAVKVVSIAGYVEYDPQWDPEFLIEDLGTPVVRVNRGKISLELPGPDEDIVILRGDHRETLFLALSWPGFPEKYLGATELVSGDIIVLRLDRLPLLSVVPLEGIAGPLADSYTRLSLITTDDPLEFLQDFDYQRVDGGPLDTTCLRPKTIRDLEYYRKYVLSRVPLEGRWIIPPPHSTGSIRFKTPAGDSYEIRWFWEEVRVTY